MQWLRCLRSTHCARSAPLCGRPHLTSSRWGAFFSCPEAGLSCSAVLQLGCCASRPTGVDSCQAWPKGCYSRGSLGPPCPLPSKPPSPAPPCPPPPLPQNLVQMRKSEGLGVLMGARVVEKIDSNTQARCSPPPQPCQPCLRARCVTEPAAVGTALCECPGRLRLKG